MKTISRVFALLLLEFTCISPARSACVYPQWSDFGRLEMQPLEIQRSKAEEYKNCSLKRASPTFMLPEEELIAASIELHQPTDPASLKRNARAINEKTREIAQKRAAAAYAVLGKVARKQNNYPLALENLREAVRLNPLSDDHKYELGVAERLASSRLAATKN